MRIIRLPKGSLPKLIKGNCYIYIEEERVRVCTTDVVKKGKDEKPFSKGVYFAGGSMENEINVYLDESLVEELMLVRHVTMWVPKTENHLAPKSAHPIMLVVNGSI